MYMINIQTRAIPLLFLIYYRSEDLSANAIFLNCCIKILEYTYISLLFSQ